MPTFGPGVQVIASGCGYLPLDTHALEIRGVPSRQCQEKRMDQGAMGWAKRSVWIRVRWGGPSAAYGDQGAMGWGVWAKCRESKSREAARGNERDTSKVAHASKRLHPRPLLQDDVRVL